MRKDQLVLSLCTDLKRFSILKRVGALHGAGATFILCKNCCYKLDAIGYLGKASVLVVASTNVCPS